MKYLKFHNIVDRKSKIKLYGVFYFSLFLKVENGTDEIQNFPDNIILALVTWLIKSFKCIGFLPY